MQTHPNTGREKAGVLPRMFAPAGALWQQYAAQKRQQDTLASQRLKDERARQDALSKYAASVLDKDLGTGTAFDPVITQAQSDVLGVISEAIKNNPDMTNADINLLANKSAARIKGASDRLKALNQNIKGYSTALNKIPGVSGQDLEQMARYEMLYTDDGKGGVRMRTIEEINSYEGDPIAAAMEKHSDKIVTREALDMPLSKLGTAHQDVTIQTDEKGVTKKSSVNVTYLPGLHDVNQDGTISTKKEIRDLSGVFQNVIPSKSAMASAVMWSPDPGKLQLNKKLPFPAKLAEYYPDGKIPQLEAGAYDRIFGTEGGALYLEKELKKQYPDLDKLSPYYDTVKREVAYNLVRDYTDRTGIKTNDVQRNSPYVTKLQLGIPAYSTRGSGKGSDGPGGGIDEKLNNTPLAIVARAMNGEQTVLEGARIEKITLDGKQIEVVNFARGLAGNLKLPDDIFGKGVEARTFAVHPDDPSKLIVESTSGATKVFQGPELRALFKNIGKIQSPPASPDDVEKILNFYFQQGENVGKIAKYDKVGWDESKRAIKLRQQSERIDLFDELENFSGGTERSFAKFKGKEISIPGKPTKAIKSVSYVKPWFTPNKFEVQMEDGEVLSFKDKAALIKFLDNIK